MICFERYEETFKLLCFVLCRALAGSCRGTWQISSISTCHRPAQAFRTSRMKVCVVLCVELFLFGNRRKLRGRAMAACGFRFGGRRRRSAARERSFVIILRRSRWIVRLGGLLFCAAVWRWCLWVVCSGHWRRRWMNVIRTCRVWLIRLRSSYLVLYHLHFVGHVILRPVNLAHYAHWQNYIVSIQTLVENSLKTSLYWFLCSLLILCFWHRFFSN